MEQCVSQIFLFPCRLHAYTGTHLTPEGQRKLKAQITKPLFEKSFLSEGV